MKKNIKILLRFSICFALIFSNLVFIGLRDRKHHNEKKYTHTLIRNFKKDLSLDDLYKMDFKFDKGKINVQDLRLDLFYEALNNAYVGGTSHPVIFERLYFFNKSSENYFGIEVDFAHVGEGRNIVFCTIDLHEDGKCIDGIPYISEQLTEWGEMIGMFEVKKDWTMGRK